MTQSLINCFRRQLSQTTSSPLPQEQLSQQHYQLPVQVCGVLSYLFHPSPWPSSLVGDLQVWWDNCNSSSGQGPGLGLYLLQACTYFCMEEKTREGLTNTNIGNSCKLNIKMGYWLGKGKDKTLTDGQLREMELTTYVRESLYFVFIFFVLFVSSTLVIIVC